MQSLREDLQDLICRRVKAANADQLLAMGIALAEVEQPIAAPRGLRLVSPAPAGERFELQHDDLVVVDRRTGLMWTRENVSTERLNWAAADEACRKLNLAGFTDWRLPTVDELFALADRTCSDPAIDKTAFPNCKAAYYWSSTPYAPSPGDDAWSVYFDSGDANASSRDADGFVRAVRASQ